MSDKSFSENLFAMRSLISSLADTSSIRYEGRAKISDSADIALMANDEWKERLKAEIAKQGKSQREVSIAAKLGPGVVNSWFNKSENKEPVVDSLISVCEVLNVSLSYILYGYEISREAEEVLSLLEKQPAKRDAVLELLRGESRS